MLVVIMVACQLVGALPALAANSTRSASIDQLTASDPVVLVMQHLQTVRTQSPTVHLNPLARQNQIVNLPTWLWIDPLRTQNVTVTSPAGDTPAIQISLQIVPVEVAWDLGDGDHVTCPMPGTAYDPTKSDADQHTNCSYTYTKTGSFNVSTGILWQVSVTSLQGVSGADVQRLALALQSPVLGAELTSTAVQVAQRQGLNSDLGPPSVLAPKGGDVYATGSFPPAAGAPNSGHQPTDSGGSGPLGFLGSLWDGAKSVAGDIGHGLAAGWNATVNCFAGSNHTCLKWAATAVVAVAVTAGGIALCGATAGLGCVAIAVAAGGVAGGGLAGGLNCNGGNLLGCVGKGAIGGGIAGLAFMGAFVLAPEAIAVFAAGGAAGFFGTLADQVMSGHFDPKQLAINTLLGITFAGLLSRLSIFDGLFGSGKPPPPELSQLQEAASVRATELQVSLRPAQQGRITMAVGIGEDSSGALETVVGTSEPNGYLRPGITLEPGEILAPGTGHAEQDILDYMAAHRIRPLTIAAGRPICPDCNSAITGSGAAPGSPVKAPAHP